MPFYKEIRITDHATLYLWKITEDYDTLWPQVSLKDTSLARLEGMKSESHQKGFLAVRMLLQHLGYTDYDLYYDEFGKPHLYDGKHISISHSFDFSAIVISTKIVGLDIEQVKPKVLKIAPRFMDMSHLENLPERIQLQKATVVWGVKEATFKIKNEKGISFPDHISEAAFTLEQKKGTAFLSFNNRSEEFAFYFDIIEDYAYVCVFEKSI